MRYVLVAELHSVEKFSFPCGDGQTLLNEDDQNTLKNRVLLFDLGSRSELSGMQKDYLDKCGAAVSHRIIPLSAGAEF